MFTLLMALEGLVLYKSINKLREIWTVTDDPAIDFNETNLLLREAKKLDQEEELIPMDEHMHKDPEPDFWWQFASIVLLNFAVQVLDVIRGGREHIGDVSVAGIDICSRTYWTIAGVEIFLFIGSAIVIPLVFIPRAARLKSREMFHLVPAHYFLCLAFSDCHFVDYCCRVQISSGRGFRIWAISACH
jgi:hypothetical protein